MSTRENESEARFQCRHILADGHRCRSACLRNEEFCYYHHASRKPVADPVQRKGRRTAFTLPRIEDRASIQAAINDILQRIAANEIDPRRAGRILYAIQIAGTNLPRPVTPRPVTSRRGEDEAPGLVEEVVQHPTFGEIAPRTALTPPPVRKSLARQLREEMEELEARNIAEFGASAEDDADAVEADTHGQARIAALERDLADARAATAWARAETGFAKNEVAKATAGIAEANANAGYAEQCMAETYDRLCETRVELEALKASTQSLPSPDPQSPDSQTPAQSPTQSELLPCSQPETLSTLQAVAELRPSHRRVILSEAQRSRIACPGPVEGARHRSHPRAARTVPQTQFRSTVVR